MEYNKFFSYYGASYRTARIATAEQIANPFHAGGLLNARPYKLPETSAIPRDFIRLDPWEGEYLFSMAQLFAKKGIVETGRYKGGSTFLLSCACPDVPIHSIDIAPVNDELLRKVFEREQAGANVNLITGDSQKTKYLEIKSYDFLFIDGDHTREGCSNDLTNWFDGLSVGGHVLLHDAYASPFADEHVIEAILDFIDANRDRIEIVIHPCKPYNPAHYPAGSICHLRKIK